MNKIENERERGTAFITGSAPAVPDKAFSPNHAEEGEKGRGEHIGRRGRGGGTPPWKGMRERRGCGGTRFVAGLQKSRACETGVVGLRMMCADERLRFDLEDLSR
jgi:hypothetical protein